MQDGLAGAVAHPVDEGDPLAAAEAQEPVVKVRALLSFCCLGFAIASIIHDQDAAQPVVQGIMLPLYFISGVFVPISLIPQWLVDVAKVFPVRRLADALLTAYDPHTRATGFAGLDLVIVAAWGVAGLIVAVRRSSGNPSAAEP
jgi:ABC-2 type transport system permease protein